MLRKDVDELLDGHTTDIKCGPFPSWEEGDTSCRTSLSASPSEGTSEGPILDSYLLHT
jgi:hypothetical protein